MKKSILAVLTIIVIFAITSCSKEEIATNPYEGTKWSKSYHSSFSDEDYMYVLEFTETTFSYYEADINGGYKSGMTQGSYTYEGNEIYIDNVKDKTSFLLDYYFTGATVTGNTLSLHYYWVSNDGERFDHDQIMGKR